MATKNKPLPPMPTTALPPPPPPPALPPMPGGGVIPSPDTEPGSDIGTARDTTGDPAINAKMPQNRFAMGTAPTITENTSARETAEAQEGDGPQEGDEPQEGETESEVDAALRALGLPGTGEDYVPTPEEMAKLEPLAPASPTVLTDPVRVPPLSDPKLDAARARTHEERRAGRLALGLDPDEVHLIPTNTVKPPPEPRAPLLDLDDGVVAPPPFDPHKPPETHADHVKLRTWQEGQAGKKALEALNPRREAELALGEATTRQKMAGNS